MRTMGKTPKKAAPGGDESNMQVRRLKATNVSSNASKDRESGSEIPTRTKVSGVDKRTTSISKKQFKSKLPGPKVIARPMQNTKQIRNSSTSGKVIKIQTPKMQSEVEELTSKLKATKEDVQSKAKTNDPEPVVLEVSETPQKQKTLDSSSNQDDPSTLKLNENGLKDENKNGHNENVDLQLALEFEVSENGKHEDENIQLTISEESKDVNTDDKNEKSDQHKESHMEADSNIVESTTSEISDLSEQPSELKEKEKLNEVVTSEMPCVSYNSSITLKNVQIKLNDCLKDNSKSSEENSEQNVEPLYKDLSFGKTLRTISGRRSLSRLRHVTLREHNRLSPNNSLFVNTSTISQDDDFKVLRHRAGLSDSISSNGTPSEKKRKLGVEESNPLKKPKIESESSFFNSSFELLKSFRRPVQVSTPNVEGYKFQTDKLKLGKNNSNVEIKVNETEIGNKWCAIM